MDRDDRTYRDEAEPTPALEVILHTRITRIATGLLSVIRSAGLLAVLAILLSSDGPVNPLRLMRLVTALWMLPGLAVLAMRWLLRARLRCAGGSLVVLQARRRTEIPLASIAALEPWLLPFPGGGLGLRLRSGRLHHEAIELGDPMELVEMVVAAGGSTSLRSAARHPSSVYAAARSRSGPRSWLGAVLMFPVFALVPTLPLFRVHQIIAYGGALGEYYQYGLGPYAAGFAIYWVTLTIYLLLYAAALGVPVELITIGCAVFAPRHAFRVRRILDRVRAFLYYGGVPVAVVLRFLPW